MLCPYNYYHEHSYFRRRRRIMMRERGKKMAINPMMMARPHQDPSPGWPLTSALVRFAAGVSGEIQQSFCTVGEKAVSGKKTPLKKNMGVMNRVKK